MTELIPSHLSSPVPHPDRTYRCQNCGCSPAAEMTFRGHRGLILAMQFLKEKGTYCRSCGLAIFRTMTSRTLVQGWWGWASFLITPFILLYNLFARRKLNNLTEPAPALDGSSGTPWSPGKPLHQRVTIVGLLIPLAVVGAIGYAIATGGAENKVGQCVVASADGTDVDFVDCSEPNQGVVTKVVDSESQCPADTIGVVEETYTSRRGRLTNTDIYCLGPDPS
ncbi:hypothetical protein [Catellatospora vulcania]|uniref:hypothetical protein n=1 Tax=Catellatospora vulcania TaxID=1460450 RepID=UPI0012D4618E|nr:hypothetical protein [Catellatospora vulcania]